MGNHDQAGCLEPFAHGGDQVGVQLAEMGSGRLAQWLLERAQVALAEPELRELELEELELVPHARGRADGHDGEIAMGDDRPPAASPAPGRTRARWCPGAASARMLSRSALRPDCSEANSGSRPPASRSSRSSSASRWRLSDAQRFEVLGRARLAPQLGEVDRPVVPVELLAQAVHLLHDAAADARRRAGEGSGAEGKQVGQAPRLGLLDVAEGAFRVRASLAPGDAHRDQALVDVQLVLEEPDLQLVLLEVAPKVLEPIVGGLVGGEGGRAGTERLLDLAEQEVRAMAQLRVAVALEAIEGALAAHAARHQLAQGQVDASEHQLGQGGLAGVSHRVEEPAGRPGTAFGPRSGGPSWCRRSPR